MAFPPRPKGRGLHAIDMMKKISSQSIQAGFLFILCCFTLCWSVDVWGHLPQEYGKKIDPLPEKIYVTPEQIQITENGILFYDMEKEMFVTGTTLSYDEKGLYLNPAVPQRGPCGLHALWCKHCRGCGVLYCPMICQCPFGGGG